MFLTPEETETHRPRDVLQVTWEPRRSPGCSQRPPEAPCCVSAAGRRTTPASWPVGGPVTQLISDDCLCPGPWSILSVPGSPAARAIGTPSPETRL